MRLPSALAPAPALICHHHFSCSKCLQNGPAHHSATFMLMLLLLLLVPKRRRTTRRMPHIRLSPIMVDLCTRVHCQFATRARETANPGQDHRIFRRASFFSPSWPSSSHRFLAFSFYGKYKQQNKERDQSIPMGLLSLFFFPLGQKKGGDHRQQAKRTLQDSLRAWKKEVHFLGVRGEAITGLLLLWNRKIAPHAVYYVCLCDSLIPCTICIRASRVIDGRMVG